MLNLKQIQTKIKDFWNSKIHDTVKEDDSVPEKLENIPWALKESRVKIFVARIPMKERFRAFFTGRCAIRLQNRQVQVIKNLKLAYED